MKRRTLTAIALVNGELDEDESGILDNDEFGVGV